MAKTLKVHLYPDGWTSAISYNFVTDIIESSLGRIIFKMRTEAPEGIVTKTVTSNHRYLIEEDIQHSGSITI